MRHARTIALYAGALIALAALSFITAQDTAARASFPSIESTGAGGLRLLWTYLRETGVAVKALEQGWSELEGATGVLIVPSPTGQKITRDERETLQRFLSRGGALAYLAAPGAPLTKELDAWLQLDEGPAADAASPSPELELELLAPREDVPVMAQRGALAGARTLSVQRGSAVKSHDGAFLPVAGAPLRPVVLWRRQGAGELFVLAGSSLAENAGLARADNLQFWSALTDGRDVWFDEWHHQSPRSVPLRRGFAVFGLQLAGIVLFFGLSVGRRLGPPRPLQEELHRSSLEYVRSLGSLLRRARAERELLTAAAGRLRRAARERVGLPDDASDATVAMELERRMGIEARTYEGALHRALEEAGGRMSPSVFKSRIAELAALELRLTGHTPRGV